MLNLLFTHHVSKPSKPVSMKHSQAEAKAHTLAQASAGKLVTIRGFGPLPGEYKQHLQAYGLLPGRTIQVLAQRPVTIVLVEQTELAFETVIADQVLID